MAVRTVTYEQTLVTVACSCGIEFAVPEAWRKARQGDHKTFFCPNGHGRHFPSKTLEEELREELLEVERALAEESNRAQRAERRAKKLENDLIDKVKEHMPMEEKIHAGVCPYCNRNFTNVRRHMRSKHLTEQDRIDEIASSKSA